jgi:hypothetical protein
MAKDGFFKQGGREPGDVQAFGWQSGVEPVASTETCAMISRVTSKQRAVI